MKVSITELKRNFSKYMKFVNAGGVIVITRYGKEVAVLVPIELYEETQEEILK